MTRFICCQCGTQFAGTQTPPPQCPICEDDRQYVGWQGQQWVTPGELALTHTLRIADEADNITGIGIEPSFAIGQRALLLRSPAGNVLWDCVSLVTEEAVAEIEEHGGLAAIAVSHPHFYSSMVEWSDAFDGVPIHIHADDRQWVMHPSPVINHWTGETLAISPEMTLIRCGGHFPGATVLHWAEALDGRGALMTGDVVMVALDRRHLSFMYSYPNLIPLNRRAVERIAASLAPFPFEAIFGGWWNRVVRSGGKQALARSVERYLAAIGD